ncbi:MAG TPA: ATP-binding protein [Woeseiaceae bacterium]|nr:ATP-binding protein [Woeseiaceae bacterium]
MGTNPTGDIGTLSGFVEDLQINPVELLTALQAVHNGDFSVRLPSDRTGIAGEIADTFNDMVVANEHLAQKARLLAARNAEVERENQEIEQARRALEDKAAELALTSRYKSEFLANMSHELRTPLNSILVLGQQLAENADKNLTERQVEYATTVRAAGADLLHLISDILDLSKIESGTVTVESEEITLASLEKTVERNFRHEAETRDLAFETELEHPLRRSIHTDPKRLLQVLKNLLSNAFKFTEDGGVKLRVFVAKEGWTSDHAALDTPGRDVIGFEVSDTGIGIPPDKQRIIFEAFQQADAGTARKHGGTGLGLAISRELAELLGGEIRLESEPGRGSTFTLYLPAVYAGPALPGGTPGVLSTVPCSRGSSDDRDEIRLDR